MFILMEEVDMGDESGTVALPRFVSKSREKLEKKMVELEAERQREREISELFVSQHREWLRSHPRSDFVSSSGYVEANSLFIENLRKEFKKQYSVKDYVLQVYGMPYIGYSIDSVEEI